MHCVAAIWFLLTFLLAGQLNKFHRQLVLVESPKSHKAFFWVSVPQVFSLSSIGSDMGDSSQGYVRR